MTGTTAYNEISDEQLVAYLDNELDDAERQTIAKGLTEHSELQERMERMERGGRPFTEAFDLLLEAAPDKELQAMFEGLLAKDAASKPAADSTIAQEDDRVVPFKKREGPARTPLWQMAAAAAILVMVFAGGFVSGGGIFNPQVQDDVVGWREAAARYVALFSEATVEGLASDPQIQQSNLQRVATALGLELSPEKLSEASLDFKGTQLLEMEGKPLAQIAYLHKGSIPVALCIIPADDPAHGILAEERHGMNVMHWMDGDYGFMVIGRVPEAELKAIAERFQAQLS